MVVIRLARFGKKHSPRYRITVADSRRWLGGKFIEVIGSYNPNPQGAEKEFVCDLEKVQSWIAKGAQPSDRVKSLLRKAQGTAKA
jgi:small subunit ribosomal protein S16